MDEESIFDFESCDDEECPAHNRIDVEEWEVDTEEIYMLTYVGEYVVYTDRNALFDREIMVRIWEQARNTPAPKWITRVLKCGAEGTLSDCVTPTRIINMHWVQEYTSYDVVFNAHGMIVDALENDMLDLSTEILPAG